MQHIETKAAKRSDILKAVKMGKGNIIISIIYKY